MVVASLALGLACHLSGGPGPVRAQDPAGGFAALADRVVSRELENGLRLIVLPQGEAPVVAFHLLVETGAIDEPPGAAGLAHFAEHMLFKGSARIGSRDWTEEAPALEAADVAWEAYEAALRAGRADAADLRTAFLEARDDAHSWSAAAEVDRALEAAGGRGQNASAGSDFTEFWVALPSRFLETWFWLAREQLGAPAMREFYREREVVLAERRSRVDASPIGRAREALLGAALAGHPYARPAIGLAEEIELLDRREMLRFWREHYGARRMVLAVVGAVEPERVFELADRYLGDLAPGAELRPGRSAPAPQDEERQVTIEAGSREMLVVGWRVPPARGEWGRRLDALGDLLVGGPAARLERRLVAEEGVAVALDWAAGYPGRLDEGLFVLYALPAPGHDASACLAAIDEEIALLSADPPQERELAGLRRRAQMTELLQIEDGAAIARALARAEAVEGDARALFTRLAALAELRAGDLQEAARALVDARRTVVFVRAEGGASE